MKEKLLRWGKLAIYPAAYFLCLLVFGYLTFPFGRLKDRLLAEIAKQNKGKGAPQIQIGTLDSYFVTGAEVESVKITLPPDETSARAGMGGLGGMGGMGALPGFGASKPEPAKENVIEIPEAHARARLLPLLIGRVQLDFWASVFGGEVSGTAPLGSSKGDVELTVSEVKLSEVEPLQQLLGLPIDGLVDGTLELSPKDGKFKLAKGSLDFHIKNIAVSDGKTKVMGILPIPTAKVSELVLQGEAEEGTLKITKLSAQGPDLELEGDGTVTLKEPWAASKLDLYVKFRFTDAYRGKDDTTKSLLGAPGSSMAPIIEVQQPKFKKAKRADGFYGFHIFGPLRKLQFEPSATDSGGSKPSKSPKTDAAGGAGDSSRKLGITPPSGIGRVLQNRPKPGGADEKDTDEKDEQNGQNGKEEPAANPRELPAPPAARDPIRRTAEPEPAPEPSPEPAPPQRMQPPTLVPPGGGDEQAPEEEPKEPKDPKEEDAPR